MIALLRQKARPYLFSNTLAPPVAAASIVVFDMLSRSSSLRDKLAANTAYFRAAMTDAGFNIRPGSHPIVVRHAARAASLLNARTVWCQRSLMPGSMHACVSVTPAAAAARHVRACSPSCLATLRWRRAWRTSC